MGGWRIDWSVCAKVRRRWSVRCGKDEDPAVVRGVIVWTGKAKERCSGRNEARKIQVQSEFGRKCGRSGSWGVKF